MTPVSCIEISRDRLVHNILQIRTLLGEGQKLCAVVKANAYGHGLAEVVRSIDNVVDYLQVDDFDELERIRELTNCPVIVLGYMDVEQSVVAAIKYNAIIGIFDCDPARFAALNDAAEKFGSRIRVFIEIDAFLGRLGTLSKDVPNLLRELKKHQHIHIEGMYGHFSDIEDAENLEHACKQADELKELSRKNAIPFHISATSGILSDPHTNWSGMMTRLGIGLYGIWPSKQLKDAWSGRIDLLPVLSWKTSVAQVKMLPAGYPVGYGKTFITSKETKVAIIPQGYSDGYDRKLSNRGHVLIHGTRCSILGRVAMNMFTVDVSSVENVSVGDEVVLIGQQGSEIVSVDDLADNIGTIGYEIVARISPLLPRKVN